MIWHPPPPADRDPVLAELMKDQPAPIEKIERIDWLLTALNRSSGNLKNRERLVILECGHSAITANLKRAPCKKCHDMILNGEDYEAFRNRSRGDERC